jgi:serine/threonine protein kinase
MAPELIKKQNRYNEKIDVWSFGIFGLEVANGNPPYINDKQERILMKIIKFQPPSVNERFSKELKAFIKRSLEKEPTERASVKELLADPYLADALDHKQEYI